MKITKMTLKKYRNYEKKYLLIILRRVLNEEDFKIPSVLITFNSLLTIIFSKWDMCSYRLGMQLFL